jgi:hypothetical protein
MVKLLHWLYQLLQGCLHLLVMISLSNCGNDIWLFLGVVQVLVACLFWLLDLPILCSI